MTKENEKKKNYLSRYGWDIKAIEEIEGEITACRLGALPGAVSYDGMPHGSGDKTDLSDYAVEIDDLLCKFRNKRKEAIRDLKEISDAIEAVEDARSNVILRYKYIQLKKWREIADAMNYTEDYVKRELHSVALQNFKIPTKSHRD